jgi:hypothetical protein
MATTTKTNRTKAASSRTKAASSRKGTRKASSSPNGASSKRSNRTRSASNGARSTHRLADAAAKAKVPLIAGVAAAAGAVGGIVARKRAERSNGPLERLRHASPPKIDLETVRSAGERVAMLGQQTADAASAVEKVRRRRS